ncbi:hypothetical protein ABZ016_41195 [Streptomyces sp. NPDC006372]
MTRGGGGGVTPPPPLRPALRRLLEITGTYEYLTGAGDGVT